MSLLADVQHLLSAGVTPALVVRNLSVALACGLVIAVCYAHVTQRSANGRSFIGALIVLTMITAIVIMVIGNNLARAFGLVGAMSIIRFRTAVKDVRDIVFIFFSLAVGMAAGVSLPSIAFTGTLFIGLVMLAVSHAQAMVQKRRDYLLQFRYTPGAETDAGYLTALEQHCAYHHLVNSAILESGESLDLSFYVRLRRPDHSSRLVLALGQVPGLERPNLFFDDEYE